MNLGFFGALLVAGCGSESPGESGEGIESVDQAIVRGTTENARQYVVALRTDLSDGAVGFCSGTLFAPRVVLTAAHCVRPDASSGHLGAIARRVLVYAGNNYDADLAALPPGLLVPPPPAASAFMEADSWEVHPNYNVDLISPDLAVVYLDRKPNFDPLPVGRTRLGTADVGKLLTLVGYGRTQGDAGSVPHVKRRGTAPFAGPPLITDAPPGPDRHPGITNSTVVNGLLKINATPPNSNACFGDSGGPAIKNVNGQDYIFGATSWGTVTCEGFGYYTRLDPFLPFLDQAYLRGGQATVIPRLECVQSRPGNTFRAYYGYANNNGVNVQVPYGTNNSLAQDTTSQRPSSFIHGDQPFDFRITAPNSQTLTWKLSPTNSPTTTVTARSTSPQCNPNSRPFICSQACEASLPAACGETYRDCQIGCLQTYTDIGTCGTEIDTLNKCIGTLPPSSFECIGIEHAFNVAGTCDAELNTLLTCLGF
jgi:hypothetical protein